MFIIKVATQGPDAKLGSLEEQPKNRFVAYMNLIKDAGNKIDVVSHRPDRLKIELEVYYDPLISDNQGVYLPGRKQSKPVEQAVYAYLNQLEFKEAISKNPS